MATTEKPARKGTARTARPGQSKAVVTRKITADGGVETVKPTARRTRTAASAKTKANAKPTTGKAAIKAKSAATKAKPVAKATTEQSIKDAAAVGKLRAKGVKWDAIAAETGMSLSKLARLRLLGKKEGIAGFNR